MYMCRQVCKWQKDYTHIFGVIKTCSISLKQLLKAGNAVCPTKMSTHANPSFSRSVPLSSASSLSCWRRRSFWPSGTSMPWRMISLIWTTKTKQSCPLSIQPCNYYTINFTHNQACIFVWGHSPILFLNCCFSNQDGPNQVLYYFTWTILLTYMIITTPSVIWSLLYLRMPLRSSKIKR